jgi:glycosyltransferase involved in cell wall biosynthesis
VHILFASPAYYPAVAFGGPIQAARELNEGMTRRGHSVEAVTTTLLDIRRGRSWRGRTEDVGGVRVHYLATPLRYRWMGITPGLPLVLARAERPDIAHVFGFRDPLGTATAAWCRLRGIPYVFEPLGMFVPRLRKIQMKQLMDRTVVRPVAEGAAAIVANSNLEREAMIAVGVPGRKVVVRGNGFPPPSARATGLLRRELGVSNEPLVLYVGRIAAGKGIEFLIAAAAEIRNAHFVFVGPDDGHGVGDLLHAATSAPATTGRIHACGSHPRPLTLYGDADVFVLPSEGESFGMVAAEAASSGTPVVVTDRCGVAEFLRDAALVVPPEAEAVTNAIARMLRDPALRGRLGTAGLAAAERNSWEHVVDRQEEIYRLAAEQT